MSLKTYDDLIQRSEAWYEARRGIVTASAVGKLITVRKLGAIDFACPSCGAEANGPCLSKRGAEPTPIKTLHSERTPAAADKKTVIEPASNDESRGLTAKLVAERIAGFVDPTWQSADMFRGQVEEPRAVDLYSETFEPARACGFMVRREADWTLGFSPDGLVGDEGLIEVKAPRGKGHVLTVLADQVPLEHVAQIQAGLLVSGRQWCDFISFAGGFEMYVVRMKPDLRWQKAIVEAVRLFEANCTEMVAQYKQTVSGMPVAERIDYDLEVVF